MILIALGNPEKEKWNMTQYDEEDAAEDTDSTIKEVKGAWHQARDDDKTLVDRAIDKGVDAVRKLFGLDTD